jgi:LDH2 family malate/lactate/ureidoglycolate dehydrogenase
MDEIVVPAEVLRAFTAALFARVGFGKADAAVQAEVLVWANLRGIDSHGVLRIPWYVELVETGLMNPRPNLTVVVETSATMLVDVDHGPGPVVTTKVMQWAISKARNAGIGWAFIRNTTHQGPLGYYASLAAQAGMAGLAIVCSPPNMAPHGAKAPGVHNSPLAIAVPAGRHERLLLDLATSVAAGGKLQLARDKGVPIPAGWALDQAGTPTTDASQAAILLPMAGPKGSGLALMFECLSSLVVNNPLAAPMLTGQETTRRHRQNGIVAAIDIGRFADLENYCEQVDATIDGLKALPTADKVTEVLMPGEPEDRTQQERLRHGIPLPVGTIRRIRPVADRLGVPVPHALAEVS